MTERCVAIVQARMGSTRLPGKVLAPILGQPMLFRLIERLGRAASLDAIVVATSVDPSDDPLAAACAARGIACHRGSLDDVLARMLAAARAAHATRIVRVTGDCPLIDAGIVDRLVGESRRSGSDYVSNTLEPTCPDGLDAEVVKVEALARADAAATLPSQREHVTPYIYANRTSFTCANVRFAPDLSALRWTVDDPQDLEFVRAIYAALYAANPAFSTADVLDLLRDRPDIAGLSGTAMRNAGYLKSLARDAARTTNDGSPKP